MHYFYKYMVNGGMNKIMLFSRSRCTVNQIISWSGIEGKQVYRDVSADSGQKQAVNSAEMSNINAHTIWQWVSQRLWIK